MDRLTTTKWVVLIERNVWVTFAALHGIKKHLILGYILLVCVGRMKKGSPGRKHYEEWFIPRLIGEKRDRSCHLLRLMSFLAEAHLSFLRVDPLTGRSS